MKTRTKSWLRWMGLAIGILALVAALIYWMVPVPTLILNKISGQISSHLPEGWSLENWQVSRSYLRQLRKGELPHLDFELTDGHWRLYVSLDPRWNASLSEPSLQASFIIRAESKELQISPFAGHTHLAFSKQFQTIESIDLDWDNQNLSLTPFGKLEGFSGEVQNVLANPEINFKVSKLDIKHPQGAVTLDGLSAALKMDLKRPLPYLESGSLNVDKTQVNKELSSGQFSALSVQIDSDNLLKFVIGAVQGSHKMEQTNWTLSSENLKAQGKIQDDGGWSLKDALLEVPAVSLKAADDKEISLELIKASGRGNVDNFQLRLAIGTGGAIWGETFFGFPTEGLSLNVLHNNQDTEAHLKGLIDDASAQITCTTTNCRLKWSLVSSFEKDVKSYGAIYPDAPPLPLNPQGRWEFSGQVPLNSAFQANFNQVVAHLDLKEASLTNAEKTWALQGIQGHFPVTGIGETHARLKIDNIQYKNLKSSLNFPDWKLYFHLANKEFRYWLPATALGGDLAAVEIGAQELHWKSPKTLQFASSLFANSKNINPLLEKACLAKADSVPEISWSARYPKILATSKKLETPNGAMSARVFTGTAKLTRFKIKDWASAIPETTFDFDIKNFNLEPLGQWLNFGRMEGLFEAFAHDVVFRAKIPTGFLSRVELLPVNKKREIIFSSKAMKNFTQLFTSQDVTAQIPGIVRWFSFGWPSDLIGGFNIKYAGISLFSNDGSILLETLDPKWVLQKERKHYLLYGNRFKIPINAMSYPVVLDAPAMSQFVSHMYYQLVGLQDKETPNDGETDETKDWCKYSLGGSAP